MKKILILVIMGASIVSAATLEVVESGVVDSATLSSVREMDTNTEESTVEYKDVKVKDAGTEYTIQVEIKKDDPSKNVTKKDEAEDTPLDKLHSKVGVILKFKNKNVDIVAFSEKFGLKLKERLVIGYYIFENTSNLTDILLVENILLSDMSTSIDTIRPNWPLGVIPN